MGGPSDGVLGMIEANIPGFPDLWLRWWPPRPLSCCTFVVRDSHDCQDVTRNAGGGHGSGWRRHRCRKYIEAKMILPGLTNAR